MTTVTKQCPKKSTSTVANDPSWQRVLARDKTADGNLWYSVVTTGVYCRPSCPSRGVKPQNVLLHNTIEEARQTGFRPCRRCNPEGKSADAENAALVTRACRLIEEREEELSLETLAEMSDRSPSYFHRAFKAITGVTPKDFAEAHRANKVRQGLADGNKVTEAMYDAGFNSSGRFYEKSTGILGMTPSQYRAGAKTRRSNSPSDRPPLVPSWSLRARRALPPSCSAIIPMSWSGASRIVFRRLDWSARIATMKPWSPAWLGWSSNPASVSLCPSMCAEPPFSRGCGKPFRTFPLARRCVTPRSPDGSACQRRSVRSRAPARQIILLSPFRAIALCVMMGRCRTTLGMSNASGRCLIARRRARELRDRGGSRMLRSGNLGPASVHRELCGMTVSQDAFSPHDDPDKAVVISYMSQAVSEGLSEWEMLGNGKIWVRFTTGEIFLLAKSKITRL